MTKTIHVQADNVVAGIWQHVFPRLWDAMKQFADKNPQLRRKKMDAKIRIGKGILIATIKIMLKIVIGMVEIVAEMKLKQITVKNANALIRILQRKVQLPQLHRRCHQIHIAKVQLIIVMGFFNAYFSVSFVQRFLSACQTAFANKLKNNN